MSNPKSSNHKGGTRMGRPPNPETHAILLNKTKELASAIKSGSGNMSNAEIESNLRIGALDQETGIYSGRSFARYLNESGRGKSVAMPPDLMVQITERARNLGWLPQLKKTSIIRKPVPFDELSIPDGKLMSEYISQIRKEREDMIEARKNAIDAVIRLSETISSSKLVDLMLEREDRIEDTICSTFLSFAKEIAYFAAMLPKTVVMVDDLNEAASLAPYVPKSRDDKISNKQQKKIK